MGQKSNIANKAETATTQLAPPTLAEAFRVWLRIGLLSFGGPAAQIALMHRIIVEEHKWLSEKDYLNALSFCMLLPGPEAMQLATYAGWRLHGVVGGIIAGLLFVIPGALVILLLATVYAIYGDVSIVSALFFGIKAAVIVIVLEALLRVSKRALSKTEHWVIAALAFIGIFFLDLPYPVIILIAAAYGFFLSAGNNAPAVSKHSEQNLKALLPSTFNTILIYLLIWWTPLLLVQMSGANQILIDIGIFFSKLAVVTFGGAYAVLAYLGQDVVTQFGWLSAAETMDGLGLAETTPGPLILVTEFVGFIAGYRENGVWLGVAAALVTLWVTFIPCFLWIFAGAPYIDWLGEQPRLRKALDAITAAVVGVILNLSIWFALHVFFANVSQNSKGILKLWTPEWSTLDLRVVVLTALCAVLALVYHWSIVRVLLLASVLGVVLLMVFPA